MMHDPFQAFASMGSYGISPQIGMHNPYLQTAQNPLAALNPLLGLSSISQFGGVPQMGQAGQGFINPQLLQLAALLSQQSSYTNPILASILSNPILAATLQSQQPGGYGGGPFGAQPHWGQIGSQGSPFGGYPLAPQSWIGQGGMFGAGQGFGQGQGYGQGFGQGFGQQVHPLLSQLTQRQGLTPWGY